WRVGIHIQDSKNCQKIGFPQQDSSESSHGTKTQAIERIMSSMQRSC
ncbi:unnamed protein product, partial [Allacma fusca]